MLRSYATPGVRDVAEFGDNTVLLRELASPDEKPFVNDVQVDDNIPGPGETVSLRLKVTCEEFYVSAITMIAPSPDWIVAISNLSMKEKGRLVKRRSGSLRVYDAGTDSGETLTASDKVTDPQENIFPFRGKPFMGRTVADYVIEQI